MTTWQPGMSLISDYFFAEALGIWHKDLCDRTYDKGTDNSSQSKGSSKQKTCDHKEAVCQDAHDAERFVTTRTMMRTAMGRELLIQSPSRTVKRSIIGPPRNIQMIVPIRM